MPFDKDLTTDPDFIERQYRARSSPALQYNINVELAEGSSFSYNAVFGEPRFGGGKWGFFPPPLPAAPDRGVDTRFDED